MDVKTVFLMVDFWRNFMSMFEGFEQEGKENLVCQMNKIKKQASRHCFLKFNQVITSFYNMVD